MISIGQDFRSLIYLFNLNECCVKKVVLRRKAHNSANVTNNCFSVCFGNKKNVSKGECDSYKAP